MYSVPFIGSDILKLFYGADVKLPIELINTKEVWSILVLGGGFGRGLGITITAYIRDEILLSEPQPQLLGKGNEHLNSAMNQGGPSNPGQANQGGQANPGQANQGGPSNPGQANPGQVSENYTDRSEDEMVQSDDGYGSDSDRSFFEEGADAMDDYPAEELPEDFLRQYIHDTGDIVRHPEKAGIDGDRPGNAELRQH